MINQSQRKTLLLAGLVILGIISFYSLAQAVVIADDYEGTSGNSYTVPGWGQTGTINSVGLQIGTIKEGSRALQIQYTLADASGRWAPVRVALGSARDLRGCKFLTIWVKGDGSGNSFHIELGEGPDNAAMIDGEVYKNAQFEDNPTVITLNYTGWRKFQIPLTQESMLYDSLIWQAGAFGNAGWGTGNGGTGGGFQNGNKVLAPKITEYRIIVHGKTAVTNSNIYIDTMQGIWNDAPNAMMIENFERQRVDNAPAYQEPYEYSIQKRNENGERNYAGVMPGGSTLDLKIAQMVPAPEGQQFLRVTPVLAAGDVKQATWYALLGGGNLGALYNYRLGPDWSPYFNGGIKFWYIGDGSWGTGPYTDTVSNVLRLRIDARGQYSDDANWYGAAGQLANAYPFETTVPMEYYSGWKMRFVPFSMLGVWADSIDPFSPPTAADLKAIKLLAFSYQDDDGPLKTADTSPPQNWVGIDDIELYTKTAPDPAKVYLGVKALADHIAGMALPMTFDGKIESHTYDNALAAMCFVKNGDRLLAEQLFNIYLAIHNARWGIEPGFYYAYDLGQNKMQVDETGQLGRGAGPNAYMLMALLYYERAYGDNPAYHTMITDIANWLASLQKPDGHIAWGYTFAGAARNEGSVEVNCDVYAAFGNYCRAGAPSGNPAFSMQRDQCKTWINTMWIPAENRFKVGDSVAVSDRALDCYGLAVAALMPKWQLGDPVYSNCLAGAINDLSNTQYTLYGGQNMTGFDFGGNSGDVPGNPRMKDGIWFEGTAQMVVAFSTTTDVVNKNFYIAELRKGVTDMCGPGAQGLSYATPFIPSQGKGPTAYTGWPMPVTNAHMASMCWYIFAEADFNPFWPEPNLQLGGQKMEVRVSNTGGWNTNLPDGGSIYNDQEVMCHAGVTDNANDKMRFYYTTNGTATSSWMDRGGTDVGTSFYRDGVDNGIVGGLREFYAIIKEPLNTCNTTIKWKPMASQDNGTSWIIQSGSDWSFSVTQAGSVIGDRNQKVLVGGGANTLPGAKPQPLIWNAAGYFEKNEENNYSALRHTPMPIPGISANTTQLMANMSPLYYYFMPELSANAQDNYKLDSNHFTTNVSDGYADIVYGQNPYLYVRTSYGDALDGGNSTIEFGYGAPGVVGPATAGPAGITGNLEYFNRDPVAGPWVWIDTITPNSSTYTEAEKHLNGQVLHYDFMRPDIAAMTKMASLPEGTTVYYCFKVRDESAGGQEWQKQLNAEGVYQNNEVTKKYFSYSLLQDDLSSPYVRVSTAPDSSALRPQRVSDSGNCSWINNYVISAELYDLANGDYSFAPSQFDNVKASSGPNSGIYHNPVANAVGAANCPVHDTRVYYRISTDTPASMTGYQASDKYITGNAVNGYYYIPDNVVQNATYDLNDIDGNGLGYVQMTGNEFGGVWTAQIGLREDYANRYLYYRIFACNNDHDPQGYVATSDNHVPSAANPAPVVGANDNTPLYNVHGVVGNAWVNPFNMAAGNACDSDRDHNWVTLTRYGGMIIGPKLVKIRAKITIAGVTKNIVAYVNAEGGTVGNIIYTEMERNQ